MPTFLKDWRDSSVLHQKGTYSNPSLLLTGLATWTFCWNNSIYFIELLWNLKDMESA